MTKQVNPNIGHCACPICGQGAAVRISKAQKYYADCLHCGRITPNMPSGQHRLLEMSVIWGGTIPDDCPTWIAEQWPYMRAVNDRANAIKLYGSVNEVSVVNEEIPVNEERPDGPPPPPPESEPQGTPEPIPEAPPEDDKKVSDGFDFLET